MKGKVILAGRSMLGAATLLGPTSAASQMARGEPVGGALVLLMGSSPGSATSECSRRLEVRHVFLRFFGRRWAVGVTRDVQTEIDRVVTFSLARIPR